MRDHVLIVEDDRRISDAIGLRLRANGYRVSVAADVEAAAAQIVGDTPDVALMDINLPDGNGISLAARMRLLHGTAGVPVILVTASRAPEHSARARALGIPLLEKPFPATTLLEAIAERIRADARH